ncbi:MAG: HEPN domain-containing protein [Candidatus Omnitrophica bacterium]|nr:HEPN domain-containing protein [Candidatus Omnitrophota bacterium]
MMDTESKFHWCLKKGKIGGRKHRGLRKIKVDQEEANNHIQKALHNLEAVDYNIKGGFGDWAVSASFYAMYHSLLAILCKLDYDSRNQECTINAIEYFIKTGKIKLDPKYIAMIRRTDELMGSDAKALREEFQYGTEIEVEDELLKNTQGNAKEFVEVARIILEEIKI